MGFLDLIKEKIDIFTTDIKDIVDGIEDIQNLDARKHIVTLLTLISYSDGKLDLNEIDIIKKSFSQIWKKSEDAIGEWIDRAIRVIDKDIAYKQNLTHIDIIKERFLYELERLSSILTNKQKEDLTTYLIKIIHSDKYVDEIERELLVLYKQNIGLDESMFDILKSKTISIVKERCPSCGGLNTFEFKKIKHLENNYQKHLHTQDDGGFDIDITRDISKKSYQIYIKCEDCGYEWYKNEIVEDIADERVE
jgi:uncharacterized tellurite resistance protein B-like protein/predicted nucleic-acid-binding Zn-ribbon protein